MSQIVASGREAQLKNRLEANSLSRSIYGGMALDKDEEVSFAARSLGGAQDIFDRLLDDLVAAERLSEAPALAPTIPGDAVAQAALGYLHANCGNCHNASEDRVPQVDLNLWLDVGVTSVEETGAWLTAVDADDRNAAGK